MTQQENRIKTQIAISQLISGYLFRNGEIQEVPEMLEQIAEDYRKEIKIEFNHA